MNWNNYTEFENAFLEKYPEYSETKILDDIRVKDYARLDQQNHTFLDYTAGNLYGVSQIKKHHELLMNGVYGNPHSLNPTSELSSQLINQTRESILDNFNGSEDYFVVFTPNASGALKIVGESYPFDNESHFLLPFDNHNSVNGIREYAKAKGGTYSYSPLDFEDLTFDGSSLLSSLKNFRQKKNKLFAYPAQSNVSGVKHSLEWVNVAQENGWDVLLDASAYVPTNSLDLELIKPDFVSISFYKMFGYPTGLGCLLIRKDKLDKLQKPWFAGGTVTLASAMTDNYILAKDHSKFEDGTLNYLDIPALKIGIEHIQKIGIDIINKRVSLLTSWLLDQLVSLKHSNGAPMVKVFGPLSSKNHGATIIFNFLEENGELHPYGDVENRAREMNISIRTGCFCNPGIDEINSHLMSGELSGYFKSRGEGSVEEMISYLHKMRGAIRVSLGLVTNLHDLYVFMLFAKSFRTLASQNHTDNQGSSITSRRFM